MDLNLCIIKECCNQRIKGRRYCKKHYLERKRQQAKQRYKLYGHYMYINECKACHNSFIAWRKNQILCTSCRKATNQTGYVKNNYENGNGNGYVWKHRRIAEEVLNRKLKTNEIVHHLDNNGKNNELTNLIVISRSDHAKLHHFLNEQKVILEKSLNDNFENYWKSTIVSITLLWLETTNISFIKIWEIIK